MKMNRRYDEALLELEIAKKDAGNAKAELQSLTQDLEISGVGQELLQASIE